ncbi:unnamed protein product [Auanema sp. JU1783]|nr:unnamed protein product [Auanema sp. JU1783]
MLIFILITTLLTSTVAFPRLERQATDEIRSVIDRFFYPRIEPDERFTPFVRPLQLSPSSFSFPSSHHSSSIISQSFVEPLVTTVNPDHATPTPDSANAENLKTLDRTVDIDGDGHLNLQEVQYAAFVHHGLSGTVVKDMFRKVDTDGDNFLTSDEFNNIRPLVIEKAENAAQHYLQTVDLDHNRRLSLPEAQAYLLREYGIGSRDVERIWKLVNPDPKAQLDAADFAKLRRRVRGMSIRLSRQIMKYADVNEDNHISLEEAQAIAFEQEGIGPGDVAAMVASVDDNQDGELNAPEFADFERIVRARAIDTSKKALKVVDADGSGTLKLDEAKRIAFEHYGFDETVLAPFFDQADENEDGQLDTVEFAGFRSVIRNRAVSDAVPILKEADFDGDGLISIEEASEKTKREDDLEEFETKALFTLADQNKSGKLDKVELADFIRLVRLSAIKFATDHFKEFDTNGDKIVTLDELAQLIETKYGVPLEITRKFFDKVDVDHSGELIPAEIVDFRHEIRKYVSSLPVAMEEAEISRDEMKTSTVHSTTATTSTSSPPISSTTTTSSTSTVSEPTTAQDDSQITRHKAPAFRNPSRLAKVHGIPTQNEIENDNQAINQPIKTALKLKFLPSKRPKAFKPTAPLTTTTTASTTIIIPEEDSTSRKPANPWHHWKHNISSTMSIGSISTDSNEFATTEEFKVEENHKITPEPLREAIVLDESSEDNSRETLILSTEPSVVQESSSPPLKLLPPKDIIEIESASTTTETTTEAPSTSTITTNLTEQPTEISTIDPIGAASVSTESVTDARDSESTAFTTELTTLQTDLLSTNGSTTATTKPQSTSSVEITTEPTDAPTLSPKQSASIDNLLDLLEPEGSGTEEEEELLQTTVTSTTLTTDAPTTSNDDVEYEVIAVEVDEKGNEIGSHPVEDAEERRRIIQEQKRLLNIPASAEVEYLDGDEVLTVSDRKKSSGGTRRKITRADDTEVELVEYMDEGETAAAAAAASSTTTETTSTTESKDKA